MTKGGDISLRKTAKVIGVNAPYLSQMINGKRLWNPEIKARYDALPANTSGNTRVKCEGSVPQNSYLAHSSSGLGHRPLKAVESSDLTPVATTQSLNEYLKRMQNQGMSEEHISKSAAYLGRYCDWLATNSATTNAESAEKYLSKSNHTKPNTRAKYATYLKAFLKYLDIPFDLTVKVPKPLPEYVEGSEIEKIVEWIKNRKTYRDTIDADLTLIETAMKTGMRRSEMGNLKVEDINLDKCRLYVRGGKGDKDRVIPIHPDLVEGLRRLIEGKAGNDSVFGLLPRSIGNKFRHWSKKAGVKIHTHSFRHYFATNLVEKGANIKVVQELLGHTSLDTTQIYLSVKPDHLEDAIGLLD